MYSLLLFINAQGASDGHCALLIKTSQLVLVKGVVDVGHVPISMLPVETNISALLLDNKVSAQREDKFT